jgi:hypothetical protein
VPNLIEVVARFDKAFRQQKARDQFLIMARRAHREREAPPAEPDFQRLLDCEPLVSFHKPAAAKSRGCRRMLSASAMLRASPSSTVRITKKYFQ